MRSDYFRNNTKTLSFSLLFSHGHSRVSRVYITRDTIALIFNGMGTCVFLYFLEFSKMNSLESSICNSIKETETEKIKSLEYTFSDEKKDIYEA